jgi:uracil phosphoribosyltransferase
MTTTGARVAGRQAIVPILRAGLGMQEAMLSMLPTAQVQHIGLYRDEVVLAPVEYYNKLPSICTVSQIYLLDPMLATAGSACAAVDILKSWAETSATPVQIKFLCIMAAPEGIAKFTARHPDVEVFVAQVDQCLNEKGYILPGLGDCGDKLFGTTPSTIRPRKASNASNK